MDSTPVVVRGSGFAAGERVRVRVRVKGRSVYGKTVTSGRRGGFVARFAGHSMPRCGIYVITAAGSKGSSARLRSPMARACGPPPQP
jgi:hypothetical protein